MSTSKLGNVIPQNGRSRPPIVRHFASVAEIIKHSEALHRQHECTLDGSSWALGRDWPTIEQTREGLMNGQAPASALEAYERIREQMNAASLTSTSTGATRRRRRVWGEEGDEIDPARMLAGSPTPWTRTIIGRTAPTVRLAVNVALSSSNTPEKFAETIARAVAVADALIVAGHSVEIVGVCASINNNDDQSATVYTWPLKGSSEPMDQARLLSAAAPGLLRTYLMPFLHLDNASNTAGKARLPEGLSEMIGTPHIIARHWEGGKEIDAQEQARRIIKASAATT